jgi:hypothetical protein
MSEGWHASSWPEREPRQRRHERNRSTARLFNDRWRISKPVHLSPGGGDNRHTGCVSLDGDPATNVPQAPHMAPVTPDELRHPPSADVDPSAGGDAHGTTQDDAEPPVRHLVIFSRLSQSSALRTLRPAT